MTQKQLTKPAASMVSNAQMKLFYKWLKLIGCEENKADMLSGYGCKSTKEMTKAQMAHLLGKMETMLPEAQKPKPKAKATIKKLSPEQTEAKKAAKLEADKRMWRQRCVAAVMASPQCAGRENKAEYAKKIIENQASKTAFDSIDLPHLQRIYNYWVKYNGLIQQIETVAVVGEMTMAMMN